ncbi:DUF3887 domain-containing protein [bacterium]|nr:DUF3887 domain-containing protein [bacterium]
MKSSIFLSLLLSFSLCAAAQDSTATVNAKAIAAAESFVDLLAAGQFEKAVAVMTPEMVKALPADKLAETWKTVQTQAGAFKKRESARVEKVKEFDMVHVICSFEKARLDVKVVLDSQRQVGGLWFAPAK